MQAPIAAYNRWLHAQGRAETMRNCATTFTALALRDRFLVEPMQPRGE